MSLMTDSKGREIDASRVKLPSGLSIWTVYLDSQEIGRFWRGEYGTYGALVADYGQRDYVIGSRRTTNSWAASIVTAFHDGAQGR